MALKIINKNISVGNSKANTGELYITGDIESYQFWDEDVTPKKIRDSLDELKDITELELHITSGGGVITAGISIINLIDKYKSDNNVHVTAYISYAASMATGIAMVADTVKMYDNAIFMVHKPLTWAAGNADDMRKLADVLDVYEQALINNYKKKFKGTDDELVSLLREETYMTADVAKQWGFVDEIIEPMVMVASGSFAKINGTLFENQRIVDIFNTVNTKKQGKEKNKMEYNEILNEQFGVTKETYEAFSNVGDLMILVEAQLKQKLQEENPDNSALPTFIDKEEILKVMNVEEATKEDVLAMLEKGMSKEDVDPEMEAKAKEFDSIKASKVKDVLEKGILAMGAENFDSATWTNAMSGMDYKGICNLEASFIAQAKVALKAGVTVSQQPQEHNNKYAPLVGGNMKYTMSTITKKDDHTNF